MKEKPTYHIFFVANDARIIAGGYKTKKEAISKLIEVAVWYHGEDSMLEAYSDLESLERNMNKPSKFPGDATIQWLDSIGQIVKDLDYFYDKPNSRCGKIHRLVHITGKSYCQCMMRQLDKILR